MLRGCEGVSRERAARHEHAAVDQEMRHERIADAFVERSPRARAEQRFRGGGRGDDLEVGAARDVGTPRGASIGRRGIAAGRGAFAPDAVAEDVVGGAMGLKVRRERARVDLLERRGVFERRRVRWQPRRSGVDRAQGPAKQGVGVGSVVALAAQGRR